MFYNEKSTFENISSCSILQIGFYFVVCFLIFVLIISYFIILFDYFTLTIGKIHYSTYFFYSTFLSYIDNPSRKTTADYRINHCWLSVKVPMVSLLLKLAFIHEYFLKVRSLFYFYQLDII